MIKTLSLAQKRVREFYRTYFERNGTCPTYSEAAIGLNMSTAGVFKHIVNLENLGYLSKTAAGQVLIRGSLHQVEVVGRVSCGYGNNISDIDIDTSYTFNERIEVPGSILAQESSGYALVADGDSMEEAGIFDGDFLVIKYQSHAQEGDIVVAVLRNDFDEKVTLKEFRSSAKGYIELKPKNKIFSPIVISSDDDIEIRGKLVGVMRNFNDRGLYQQNLSS